MTFPQLFLTIYLGAHVGLYLVYAPSNIWFSDLVLKLVYKRLKRKFALPKEVYLTFDLDWPTSYDPRSGRLNLNQSEMDRIGLFSPWGGLWFRKRQWELIIAHELGHAEQHAVGVLDYTLAKYLQKVDGMTEVEALRLGHTEIILPLEDDAWARAFKAVGRWGSSDIYRKCKESYKAD